jgi:hypothetical protein
MSTGRARAACDAGEAKLLCRQRLAGCCLSPPCARPGDNLQLSGVPPSFRGHRLPESARSLSLHAAIATVDPDPSDVVAILLFEQT